MARATNQNPIEGMLLAGEIRDTEATGCWGATCGIGEGAVAGAGALFVPPGATTPDVLPVPPSEPVDVPGFDTTGAVCGVTGGTAGAANGGR